MVRKTNDDLENLQNGYEDLKSSFIQKLIKLDHYIQNVELISKQLDTMFIYNELLLEDLKSALVKIRVQMKKDKPLTVVFLEKMIFVSGDEITVKELEEERKALNSEILQSSENSRIRNNK